jgi:aryl-alcohol dehydrogenase-like predicted oxidoreductase
MRYRTLGRTGLSVSEIGHGLWGMGGWTGSDEASSIEALKASRARGCTFYDSAWAYGEGRSDALLSHIGSEGDHSLVLASKVPPKNWKWPSSPADTLSDVYPVDHVIEFAEDSCRRAGVDTLTLMQLHVWDDAWATDPGFEKLVSEIKKRKLCLAFGLSLNRWEPSNGLRAIRTGLVDTVQVIYNVFDQSPEDELLPLCAEQNVGVIARVPLDEGSLGGKFTLETRFPPDDWRAKYFGPENLPPTVERVEKLRQALPPETSLPDVALRFILQNPVISTVIVGMRTLDHIEANLAASGRPIEPSLMVELRKHRWDRPVTEWAN